MTLPLFPRLPAVLPADSLSDLSDDPVMPDGVAAPLSTLLGMGVAAGLVVAVVALMVVFAQLTLSAMGRGGDGAERLVRNVMKVFIGGVGVTSVLQILRLILL